RESDTMARIDGDEFAVVLESLTEKDDAAITAQRLLAALAGPIHLESLVIEVTATVGAAFYPSDAQNVDTLLQNAEVAMCHGKERKRNHCQFYSPTLHLETRRDQLRRAKVEQGYARLTPREREVLHILVAGSANKMIAYMLGTSTRKSWTKWTPAHYRNWFAWCSVDTALSQALRSGSMVSSRYNHRYPHSC